MSYRLKQGADRAKLKCAIRMVSQQNSSVAKRWETYLRCGIPIYARTAPPQFPNEFSAPVNKYRDPNNATEGCLQMFCRISTTIGAHCPPTSDFQFHSLLRVARNLS